MGMKYKNLKELCDRKINVHSFASINNFEELKNYSSKNEKFSMRFDRDYDYHQLPFYKFNCNDYKTVEERDLYLAQVMEEAKSLNCSVLCANGYLYDCVQICNFVIKIDDKYNFLLEFSTKEVSLREMYEYPTTVISGNIKDNLKEMAWIRKNDNIIDNNNIEKILNWAFKLNIINKNIEATLYKKKVGILKEDIACWQID